MVADASVYRVADYILETVARDSWKNTTVRYTECGNLCVAQSVPKLQAVTFVAVVQSADLRNRDPSRGN
jgi:hypothetical protein